MFTGSTATGRSVAEQAGRALIGASMELGGKNAMIVLADADLDRAAEGAAARAVLQRRPAVHLDRAAVRARVGRRRVHRQAGRARARDEARHAGLDYAADMGSLISARPAGDGHRARRGRGRQGRDGARRRPPAARPRPVLLRADRARGRRRRHDAVPRRDVRAGRRRSRASRPRTRSWPAPTTPTTGSTAACGRATPARGHRLATRIRAGHRQRQRGLLGGVGLASTRRWAA